MKRILIVDDDKFQLNLLHHVLDGLYIISTADNGNEAVKKIGEFNPDLIIMDIDMPNLDGYQACVQIRELGYDMPVIFLSGRDSLEDKLKAFDSGGDDFFTKPLENKEITQRIKLILVQREEKQKSLQERQGLLEVAQRSITDLSYLGAVVNFLQKTFLLKNYENLSNSLFSLLETFGLHGTLMIQDDNRSHYYFDDGVEKPVETILMSAMSADKRIMEFGNRRAAFNWRTASLLIKNMPEDELNSGAMKDYLAYVMNGVEECIAKISIEKKLSDTVMRFKLQNQNLKHDIADLLEDMEIKLEDEFSKAGMDDDMSLKTEDALIKVVKNTRTKAYEELDKGKSIEVELNAILDDFHSMDDGDALDSESVTLF